MRRISIALLAGLLTLSGCQEVSGIAEEEIAPSPLLFEVSREDGAVEGWLFGTIHSLPANTQWRTPRFDRVIEEADLVVVEIAGLEDSAGLFEVFSAMATSPGQPPLASRVPQSRRDALGKLIAQSDYSAGDFANIETWAAALMLAQVAQDGSSSHGADRVILREFAQRPVAEFEGARRQLSIFDTLPESDQADLLVGVVEETAQRADDPDKLRRAWLAGDERTLKEATRSGIMADAELRDALLVRRNTDWTVQLLALIEGEPKPLVAVGAGHLVGDDGLPEMLEDRGLTVRRIQ